MNFSSNFSIDYSNALANNDCIIKGDKYRITVLTERLIRLEYSDEGIFVDNLTELVWNRKFQKPNFNVLSEGQNLIITSPYFKLEYYKEKPFMKSKSYPSGYLRVYLDKENRMWYYNNKEIRNYGGLIQPKKDFWTIEKLSKGLYSTDGFTALDDSFTNLLNQNGTFIKKENKSIDVYVFMYKKDFGLALKDYYALTGNPTLISRYALGIWWSKNEPYSDTDIVKLLDTFADKEIPLSILMLDKPWMDLEKFGYTFSPSLYKNPYESILDIHKRGVKLGLNINMENGISVNDNVYQYFKEVLNYNDNKNIPLIPFNPSFITTYFKYIIRPLESLGVDFFWIDYNLDNTSLFLLNHYHYLDSNRLELKRGITLARNTNIAPHRYSILYSGKTITSFETLKRLPFYTSSASNMGVSFFSHDIGGYNGGIEDGELYIRYLQFGVFSPILRFHSDNGKYYRKEPWKWPIDTFSIAKLYLKLRHRLIPYLYSESYKYYKYGTPLVQPLYYRFPFIYDEPIYKNQYYFGSEFLISPIVNKKDMVMNRAVAKIFLPSGIWYEFKTGKKFPGDRSYISFYRDEDYPVFVKAGAIIPLLSENDILNFDNPNTLDIHIFPGKSNSYNLYEDDGNSQLYKKGFYIITNIDYNYLENNYNLIIRPVEGKTGIIRDKRNYRIIFRNTKESKQVSVFLKDSKHDFISYVEDTDFIIEVKDVPTNNQLTVICRGDDIEIDALRLINEDIDNIISDLLIETSLKEELSNILFGEYPIKKKRIEVKKLSRKGLEDKFIRLFIRLLEYVDENMKEYNKI